MILAHNKCQFAYLLSTDMESINNSSLLNQAINLPDHRQLKEFSCLLRILRMLPYP